MGLEEQINNDFYIDIIENLTTTFIMKKFKITLIFTLLLSTVYSVLTTYVLQDWVKPEYSGISDKVNFLSILLPSIFLSIFLIGLLWFIRLAGFPTWSTDKSLTVNKSLKRSIIIGVFNLTMCFICFKFFNIS